MSAVYLFEYPEAAAVAEALKLKPDRRFAPVGAAVTGPTTPRAIGDSPFVAINGSGNHHHETLGLVAALAAEDPARSFSYLHLDAHPDTGELYRWRYNCASFVGRVLELPQVAEVDLIGINPAVLETEGTGSVYFRNLHYYHCDYFAKLRQWTVEEGPIDETYFGASEDDLRRALKNPAIAKAKMKEVRPPKSETAYPALVVKWRPLSALDPSQLPEAPIYVSVDLDVLKLDLVTDWRKSPRRSAPTPFGVPENQGEMSLPTLLALIAQLGAARPMLGADVCGLTERLGELSPEAQATSIQTTAAVVEALQAALAAKPKKKPKLTSRSR
ncbi:MAG: hypothetical protein U1E65_06320 [Myxococcota bacterium]